ncbi:MAG: Ppx/GppA phosphatase family protein [Pseudomonadota bacterium]
MRDQSAQIDQATVPDPKSKNKRRRRGRRRKKAHVAGRPVAEVAAPALDLSSAPQPDVVFPIEAKIEAEKAQAQQPKRTRYFNARTPHRSTLPAYAALDLGTNNCRLLVAVPGREGQFRVVDAFSRIVRLGEGLGHANRLSDQAMDRSIEALAMCKAKLENRPIRRMRLIATEACRAAENGGLFLDRVKREVGLDLEIVDRETEAKLAVAGCSSLVERNIKATVVFDIGGGSSEIALLDLTRRCKKMPDNIVAWTSLPLGVVTLAEQFGGLKVTPKVFDDMKAAASREIEKFERAHLLDEHIGTNCFTLLGTSGTVTTLAGIHLELEKYDRRRVDGLWLKNADVDAINEKLLGWSFEERVANPCIGPDRADLVLAGCAILEAIRERWPSNALRVADRGLREGILTELMATDRAWDNQKHGHPRRGVRHPNRRH